MRIRQARSQHRARRVSSVLLVVLLAVAAIAAPARAAHESGFSSIPVVGGLTLTLYSGTLQEFRDEAEALHLVSCFATVDGRFVGYATGAPPIVNAEFAARFSAGMAQQPLICRRDAKPPAEGVSIFQSAQVVSFYGYPGIPVMGILGAYSPTQATTQVAGWARQYEQINEANEVDRQVIGALHLIAAVAQRSPTGDGTYLGRMSDEVLEQYVEATRAADQLLFLDVQVGWSTPLAEAQRLSRWLTEPHVHLAVDPEFATASKDVAPGLAIGTVTGTQINAVQAYLRDLAIAHGLPRKILVVHQFRDDMITAPGDIRAHTHVDLVIDMDGFGPWNVKLAGYNRFALSDYAQYAGFKLFFEWDTPLRSPAEIQAMAHPPDLIIYQ